MNNRLNKYKYPGAKRLMLEAQELKDNTEDYCAQPLEDNLFEWHFTVRGPPDTAFDGGYYHGRLSFPTEYPMKPPSIILLTPNGRFETNKKICLSISGYHPETWQPSWSVRTALLALIAFMPTKANRAIGSLDFPDAERRRLAFKSRTWRCETCGLIKDLLVHPAEANNFADGITTDNCEQGSTRVCENSNEVCQSDNAQGGTIIDGSEGSSDSNNSDRSMSSSISNSSSSREEDPDSLPEAQRSTDSNPENSSTKTSQLMNKQQDELPNLVIERLTISQSDSNEHSQSVQSNGTSSSTLSVSDHRRSYPSLVLKSIFLLLAALILRRVFMII